MGQTADSWLLGEFVRNLEQNSKAVHEVSIIYPSVENVTRSIYGMLGGACLPYSSKTHQRQLWLNKFLM